MDHGPFSSRHKLECCEEAFRFGKSFDPFLRALRRVFLGVCGSDGAADARAADRFTSDRNFHVADLDRACWFMLERAEPAGRFVVPRTDEHSVVNDDDPNTRITMRRSAAYAENLRLPQRVKLVVGKNFVLWHKAPCIKL